MITMNDIIREEHPTLRKVAKEVPMPLSDEDKEIGEEMMTFLINSQDPELSKKYKLRGGVGLAAPQLNISKRMIAIHIPSMNPEISEPTFSTIMYNPKLVSHSVQRAFLKEGEGCLSIDRPIEGYAMRHARITVSYTDSNGQIVKKKFKGYEAIVVQHELDHLNGILFFDRINQAAPYSFEEDDLSI